MAIFVDTSAFYALLDADDENHEPSAGAWREIMASDEDVLTTNYILVETFALVQGRLGLDAAREFQENVVPVLEVQFVAPEIHRLGIAALLAASRRSLSLVDCVSFEVMRDLGIKSVFTFDGHFTQYGFSRLPQTGSRS
jgi:predicted nucleic acid-binding protein